MAKKSERSEVTYRFEEIYGTIDGETKRDFAAHLGENS